MLLILLKSLSLIPLKLREEIEKRPIFPILLVIFLIRMVGIPFQYWFLTLYSLQEAE